MQRQEGGNLSTKLMFALVPTEYTSNKQKERGDPKIAPAAMPNGRTRLMQRLVNRIPRADRKNQSCNAHVL
jgi:hypothetical protein